MPSRGHRSLVGPLITAVIAGLVVVSLGAIPAAGLSAASSPVGEDGDVGARGTADTNDTSATFPVTDIEVEPRTVSQGENVTVVATISNMDARTDTRAIRVAFGQFLGHEAHIQTRNLTLGPLEEGELTFELATAHLPPADDYGVFVMAGVSGHMDFHSVDVVPGGDGTIHYQVDLIQGHEQNVIGPAGVNPFYGQQSRLIRFLHGSTVDAVTRSGSPGSDALADEHADCVESGSISVDEENDTASVSFTVEEGCELRLTLVSYVKPGAGFDRAHLQIFFDRDFETVGPGTHTLTVDLPTEDDYQSVRAI